MFIRMSRDLVPLYVSMIDNSKYIVRLTVRYLFLRNIRIFPHGEDCGDAIATKQFLEINSIRLILIEYYYINYIRVLTILTFLNIKILQYEVE